MSIYIKNAKVPECCAECSFDTLFSDDVHYCTVEEILTEDYRDYWECRPLFCPLIEVSEPHGRLIDADALIEDFNKLNEWLDLDEEAEIVSLINNAPTVQAEPKTGKWIKATGVMPPEFHGHHCCSECGNFANMEPPFGNREDLSKFCPNCGIRMLREDGETE